MYTYIYIYYRCIHSFSVVFSLRLSLVIWEMKTDRRERIWVCWERLNRTGGQGDKIVRFVALLGT